MTTHRDLTTPEEVLAALRAGETVERSDNGYEWTPSVYDAHDAHSHHLRVEIASIIEFGVRYRAPARPRTFTAAEVAEAFAGLEAKWRAEAAAIDLSQHDVNDRAGLAKHMESEMSLTHADELHERITHWLRENEG